MAQMDLDSARSDFRTVDHNAPEFCAPDAAVRAEAWGDLRERCPVGRSDNHGGYWILSDYASVAEACRNSEAFEHRYGTDEEHGIYYIGRMGVPRWYLPELEISEAYGEHHAALRRVLNPFFAPPVVARFEPLMQQVAGLRWWPGSNR